MRNSATILSRCPVRCYIPYTSHGSRRVFQNGAIRVITNGKCLGIRSCCAAITTRETTVGDARGIVNSQDEPRAGAIRTISNSRCTIAMVSIISQDCTTNCTTSPATVQAPTILVLGPKSTHLPFHGFDPPEFCDPLPAWGSIEAERRALCP